MKHKRLNHRQYAHRLLKRKCWDCNDPLLAMNGVYGWTCPSCKNLYAEDVLHARERDVRTGGL